MSSKLIHPFAVLGVLSKYSDKEHILTQPEILYKLENEYSCRITRKTFYHSISILLSNGFDIETYTDNHKGYYLKARPFSEEQALFFCTMLEGSEDLSKEEKEKTRDAFLAFLSRPMSKEVLAMLCKNETGRGSSQTVKNLYALSRAIRTSSQVKFEYIHYDIKKTEKRNDKPFDNMEPRFIVTKDSKYYLITSGGRHNSISHYRIDKIRDIEIKDKFVASEFRYQDAYDYALKSIFMFSGKPIHGRLRVNKSNKNAFDIMLDEFGFGAHFEDYNEEWFDVLVECSPQGLLVLAQKYLDICYIVSPKSLQEEYLQRINRSNQWIIGK